MKMTLLEAAKQLIEGIDHGADSFPTVWDKLVEDLRFAVKSEDKRSDREFRDDCAVAAIMKLVDSNENLTAEEVESRVNQAFEWADKMVAKRRSRDERDVFLEASALAHNPRLSDADAKRQDECIKNMLTALEQLKHCN